MRQWMRRNRAEFVTAVVLVMLAAGGAGGYFAYQSLTTARQVEAQEQYAQDNAHRYRAGEVVRLDAAEDDQGLEHGYHAGFDWEGTVEAEVTGTSEHPSLAAAGATEGRRSDGQPLDYDDSIDHQGAPMRYVECDLRLRNVDAEAESPMPGLRDASYAFNSSIFTLVSTDPGDTWFLGGFVWFDGGIADAPPDDGFYFVLKPGEERTLRMLYAVPASVPIDHLALRVGASGDDKYEIALGSQ